MGDILGRSEQGMQRNPLPFCAAPFSLLLICRDGILLKGYWSWRDVHGMSLACFESDLNIQSPTTVPFDKWQSFVFTRQLMTIRESKDAATCIVALLMSFIKMHPLYRHTIYTLERFFGRVDRQKISTIICELNGLGMWTTKDEFVIFWLPEAHAVERENRTDHR